MLPSLHSRWSDLKAGHQIRPIFSQGGAYWLVPAVAQNMQPGCNFSHIDSARNAHAPLCGDRQACTKLAARSTRALVGASLKSPKEYAISGSNRPSGPATRKSLDLADQIERDELENQLPDALNHADDDDLDDEPDTGKPRR